MRPFPSASVATVYDGYPPNYRRKLLAGLVQTFRARFPRDFKYEGNRAILFAEKDQTPRGPLAFCIGAALTYQWGKKATRRVAGR